MSTYDANGRALRAAAISRERGITQVEIAEAVGASQSQVSRILAGRGARASRLLEEVCLYVERRSGTNVTVDAVRSNEDILAAVQSVWDGSSAHARALAAVIRSLAVLAPRSISGAQTTRRRRE